MLLQPTVVAATKSTGDCLRRTLASSLSSATLRRDVISPPDFCAGAHEVASIGGWAAASAVSVSAGVATDGRRASYQFQRQYQYNNSFVFPAHGRAPFSSEASATAAAEPATENANNPDDVASVTSAGVIQTGTIKCWFRPKGFGYIIPDRSDVDQPESENDEGGGDAKPQKTEKELQKKNIFLHFRGLAHTKMVGPYIHMDPYLVEGQRVRFEAVPNVGGHEYKLRAINVRYADGKDIPMSNPNQLQAYMKERKGQFGDRLYAILEEAQDREEMERRVVEEFERCEKQVMWADRMIEYYLTLNKNWGGSYPTFSGGGRQAIDPRRVREGTMTTPSPEKGDGVDNDDEREEQKH